LLICLSKSWICGSSEKGEFTLVICASHWGLIETEDKIFGLKLMPLSCYWFDRQIPIRILSEWVRQRGCVVVWPFLFGDKLSICYITFAYVYNKLFTFISLHNNWIVLLGNFFVIGICELYIVQCKLGGDMWIFTNIQW
jgi:hypothetical protein